MGRMSREKEVWRAIEGYEGLYEVSNMGRIKSLPKYHYKKSVILKPVLHKKQGRYSVMLCKNPHERKRIAVHRLVATAFVNNPKPDLYKEINHKDENPANNCADNLEWCDRWYNMHYNDLPKRIYHPTRPVEGISENEVIKFESLEAAKKAGFDPSAVRNAATKVRLNGSPKMYKGYKWRFINEYKQ